MAFASIGEKLQKKCPLNLCDGSGVIPEDVEDGEGHTERGVGERPCPHTEARREGDDGEVTTDE